MAESLFTLARWHSDGIRQQSTSCGNFFDNEAIGPKSLILGKKYFASTRWATVPASRPLLRVRRAPAPSLPARCSSATPLLWRSAFFRVRHDRDRQAIFARQPAQQLYSASRDVRAASGSSSKSQQAMTYVVSPFGRSACDRVGRSGACRSSMTADGRGSLTRDLCDRPHSLRCCCSTSRIERPLMAGSGRRGAQTRRRTPVLQGRAAPRLSRAPRLAACGRYCQFGLRAAMELRLKSHCNAMRPAASPRRG
jgi:hypothetical protein